MWRVYIRSLKLDLNKSQTRFLSGNSLLFNNKTQSILISKRKLVTKDEILTKSLKEPIRNPNPPTPQPPLPKDKYASMKKFLAIFGGGALSYLAISFLLDQFKVKKNSDDTINYSSQNLPGRIVPSKSIIREKNPGNLRLTLYQYSGCPFCSKVRAYLDYFGYTYDLVEVNSISKKQLDWSVYKKVPIVAIQLPLADGSPDQYEEKIVQLNDSSVIISALETFRLDTSTSIRQVLLMYEPVKLSYETNEKKQPNDYINKYFIMLHNDKVNDGKSLNERKEERQWRNWVDTKFIHVISPNVYRTFNEALATFDMFDKAGNWDQNFNKFERYAAFYIGSVIMYLLSIRLKSKHNLKADVRLSLYEYCNEWTSSIDSNQQFRGGSKPNLADLNLYGAIGSFEGTEAFVDMLTNTKIKNWYDAMKEQVTLSKGSLLLNNPFSSVKHSMDNCDELKKESSEKKAGSTKSKRFYIF